MDIMEVIEPHEENMYKELHNSDIKNKDFHFLQVINGIEEAVFLADFSKNFPSNFVYVNEAACKLLMYTEEELLKIPLSKLIYNENNCHTIKAHGYIFENTSKEFELDFIKKNGEVLSKKVSVRLFTFNNSKYLLFTTGNNQLTTLIEEETTLPKLLYGVLKGINDVIGVYKPDGTVMFYNEAGYKFYGKTHFEVSGKKCHEMFDKSKRCKECTIENVIKLKKIIKTERFIEQFNKYMEVTCSPVLNENGEVILIIEQLRDITEQKRLEKEIKESEERYKGLTELSPDAIVVLIDGKIVLANHEAGKMAGTLCDDLIGRDLKEFICNEYIDMLEKRMKHILDLKKSKSLMDYKVISNDKKIIDVQISSNYLSYQGKPAIQCVIRDITDYKKNLNNAASKQVQSLQQTFPICSKAYMEVLYKPAKTISGDYFIMKKVHDNLVVGILFDVSGKGITASMNISAFKVLFYEAVSLNYEPIALLNELNKKVLAYLDENYIAACSFSFDFGNNMFNIAGAGINRFMVSSRNKHIDEKIIKGPFLGMFEDSEFDEMKIKFKSGDKFYLFTDGLDPIFDNRSILNTLNLLKDMNTMKKYISNCVEETLIEIDHLMDDSTLIAVEIK